ncbi:hypothetical protein ACSNOH_00235 [Streptomyces sp. URMC 127]|uniref:hypothetical protein n=1 Tax=Streptomyces sp. URMC 127 TaxID=3423402 RepID=UPI003F1A6FD6
MSGAPPTPSPSSQAPGPQGEPAPSAGRRRWRSTPARLGFLAGVPVAGLVEPRFSAAVLVVALVVVWRRNPWPRAGRIAATVAAVAMLGAVVPDPPKAGGHGAVAAHKNKTGGASPATPASPTAPRPTAVKAAASPAPEYRGQRLDVAFGKARKAGYSVTQHDASDQHKSIIARSLWTVCFQETGGSPDRPSLDFGAVHTGDPCPKKDGEPVPWPVMPELVWKTWPAARAQVVALGVEKDHVRARAAYRNDTLPAEGAYDTWRVCTHDPAEGRRLPRDTWVTLYLSSQDNGCPEPDRANGTSVDLPDRDDDGDPDYRDPFPGDHDRNTAFPDGHRREGGDSGSSHHRGGGFSVCRHTRWC